MRILSVRNRTQVLKSAKTLARLYATERTQGTLAKHALFNAKTRLEWDRHECGEHDVPQLGSVRLRILPDEDADLDNLFGDTYSHKANPEIPEARLERERQAEIERINRDGVWGIVGEFFDGEDWQHADSCWGFVGEDWKHSGYETDIMHATLEPARNVRTCPTCGRPARRKVN